MACNQRVCLLVYYNVLVVQNLTENAANSNASEMIRI